jgi:hypothetical protein
MEQSENRKGETLKARKGAKHLETKRLRKPSNYKGELGLKAGQETYSRQSIDWQPISCYTLKVCASWHNPALPKFPPFRNGQSALAVRNLKFFEEPHWLSTTNLTTSES